MTIHIESKVAVRVMENENNSLSSFTMNGTAESAPVESIDGVASELRLGKLHLVDLAGSERVHESKTTGGTMLETQSINKSLLALGDVLHALALNAKRKSKMGLQPNAPDNASDQVSDHGSIISPEMAKMKNSSVSYVHIPYLNSKLTHLLKDSLGGNSRTAMITTITPNCDDYHHSYYTLLYAIRAKQMQNSVFAVKFNIRSLDIMGLDATSEFNAIR